MATSGPEFEDRARSTGSPEGLCNERQSWPLSHLFGCERHLRLADLGDLGPDASDAVTECIEIGTRQDLRFVHVKRAVDLDLHRVLAPRGAAVVLGHEGPGEGRVAGDGKSGKYLEFKGNVASVYSHPLSKGGSSGGHYSRNAETYMNVGEAMGKAMVELLGGSK